MIVKLEKVKKIITYKRVWLFDQSQLAHVLKIIFYQWWSFDTGNVEVKSAVHNEASTGAPDTCNDADASQAN